MQILRSDHIVLTVADIDASLKFYVGLLGMESDTRNGRYAVRYGEQKINFHVGGPAFLPTARHVCMGSADFCLIAAGDIASVFAELMEKDAPFEEPQGIVRRTGALGPMDSIYLRDPDGNLVEISVYP